MPDTLSVILRSASFIAMLQAAGMVLFIAMFGRLLEISAPALRKAVIFSGVAAIVLLTGQYSLEAARMADDMSGMLDPALQMMAVRSVGGAVLALRIVALSIIIAATGRGATGNTFAALAAAAVAASFLLTGHTAAHPRRWALAPLLLLHVSIVAFWFGSLVPLYASITREHPSIAATVFDAFSKVAFWLVPSIFVAGALMGLILVPHLHDLKLPYGISLLTKASGFALLMGIAAFNKWRWGPAIGSGEPGALRSMRRSLIAEYVLIATVLSVTAAMTMLYSPEA